MSYYDDREGLHNHFNNELESDSPGPGPYGPGAKWDYLGKVKSNIKTEDELTIDLCPMCGFEMAWTLVHAGELWQCEECGHSEFILDRFDEGSEG